MLTVIQEAGVTGTRRVDDLMRALGVEGISNSEVSRICAGLDAEARALRARPPGDLADHPGLVKAVHEQLLARAGSAHRCRLAGDYPSPARPGRSAPWQR